MVKKCIRCKREQEREFFYNDGRAADGKSRYCKTCAKHFKEIGKPTDNARRRKNYAADSSLKTIIVAKTKNWRYRLRVQLLETYGGKCACCGEEYVEFLTLDHVYGGGCKERRKTDMRTTWLHAIKIYGNGEFQLLCMNCNWAKGKYGNCPHQQQLRIVG